jgi:Pyruvate/2-oxoglutarate dehydrogenase complex, dihydrolipoamide acyltransferase (E2) component, and related enzymes
MPPRLKPARSGEGERVFASPLARRVAKEKGLDLKSVKGSGPKGRIILRDVEGAEAAPKAAASAPQASAPAAAPAPKPAGASDEMTLKLFDPDSYELIPHDGMRKTIARRLTESKQTVPHFYCHRRRGARCAARPAQGHQRRRADHRRQADLQGVGQRHGDQGLCPGP